MFRVSLFHLLDGGVFRMGGHGAMIGSRDFRNSGHSWYKTLLTEVCFGGWDNEDLNTFSMKQCDNYKRLMPRLEM